MEWTYYEDDPLVYRRTADWAVVEKMSPDGTWERLVHNAGGAGDDASNLWRKVWVTGMAREVSEGDVAAVVAAATARWRQAQQSGDQSPDPLRRQRGATAPPETRAPEPAYSPRLVDALQVAATLHIIQYRKSTTTPYLTHLLGACSIALAHGATEDEAIAALLHDAIEDVEPVEIARKAVGAFGAEVLRLVEACTDADTHPKPEWRERKERYVRHLGDADHSVLLVSASDKLDNARAIVADLRTLGPKLWSRFNAGRDGQLWYYRALVTAFRANPAHLPALIDELDRTVAEMERLGAVD